jgi:hypothetical protein
VDAKKGSSSLFFKRKLGVTDRTVWLLHNRIMQAMGERVKSYVLSRKPQHDDTCLDGEHNGGMSGRGSQNKVPISAIVSLDEAGLPFT